MKGGHSGCHRREAVQLISRSAGPRLDDFNLLKAKDEVREAMLELFDRRWNKRGLIISSQYPFDQWYEYIGGRGDQRDAMMDRIANGSHRLELKGPSMREKREKVMK